MRGWGGSGARPPSGLRRGPRPSAPAPSPPPTRRPQAPGLCLSWFAWQATAAGFSPSGVGSSSAEPARSVGLHSLPHLPFCHFLPGRRRSSCSRGVGESPELEWAPGQWQPGDGAQPRLLGEAATHPREPGGPRNPGRSRSLLLQRGAVN